MLFATKFYALFKHKGADSVMKLCKILYTGHLTGCDGADPHV